MSDLTKEELEAKVLEYSTDYARQQRQIANYTAKLSEAIYILRTLYEEGHLDNVDDFDMLKSIAELTDIVIERDIHINATVEFVVSTKCDIREIPEEDDLTFSISHNGYELDANVYVQNLDMETE